MRWTSSRWDDKPCKPCSPLEFYTRILSDLWILVYTEKCDPW